MSKQYKECDACGAHLDAGEHCDCQNSGRADEQITTKEPIKRKTA